MRCLGQQSHGFSRLPQPIKRHEALKNDVESGGVKKRQKNDVSKKVRKRKAGINPPRLF